MKESYLPTLLQMRMLVGFLDAASDVASRLADDLTTRASARPRP